jgi:hypothetical protein
MHKLGRKNLNQVWKHAFIVGIIVVVVFIVIIGIVEIVSIVVVFGVCSVIVFDVVGITDNQWGLATMLPIVVVGLQAPLVLAFVMMMFFNLQQLIARCMVNDFQHQHVW